MAQVMDKRLIAYVNWFLVVVTLVLAIIGVVNLYSACTVRLEDGFMVESAYKMQIVWFGLGIICMVACMLFDYRRFSSLAWSIFFVALVALLLVFIIGYSGGGATRWISLGFVNVQPSEAAKVAVVILGARQLAAGSHPLGWAEFGKVMLVALIPGALIMMQPDLGTALILLLVLGCMCLYRGVQKQILKVGLVILLVSPIVIWKLVLPNLLDYQQQRIIGFVNPDKAPPKVLYQNRQSKITIGSGQVWGKGYLEGTQSKLKFLPAKNTDFAIAVWGEEWGFTGCVALVGLFCALLAGIFAAARDAKDRFGSMLAAGVYFYFFWPILINIGMVTGILPVVGIPLPFISYGGSSMLVTFCLLGIVLNISMRRFVFKNL